jgi:hypothetical protein
VFGEAASKKRKRQRVGINRNFFLVPNFGATLWGRSSRRDSVSVASRDDFKRRPHAHPPPTETEFRLTDPLPKRFAIFGNESRRGGGKIRSSKFEFSPPLRRRRHRRPEPLHDTALRVVQTHALRRCPRQRKRPPRPSRIREVGLAAGGVTGCERHYPESGNRNHGLHG